MKVNQTFRGHRWREGFWGNWLEGWKINTSCIPYNNQVCSISQAAIYSSVQSWNALVMCHQLLGNLPLWTWIIVKTVHLYTDEKEEGKEGEGDAGETSCLSDGVLWSRDAENTFDSLPFFSCLSFFLGFSIISILGSLGVPHPQFPWPWCVKAAVPHELLSTVTSCQCLGVMLPSYSCWGNLKLEFLHFRAYKVSITAVNLCCFSLGECEARICECQLLGWLKLECSYLETVNHDSLPLCRMLTSRSSSGSREGNAEQLLAAFWEAPVRGGHILRGLLARCVSPYPERVSTLTEET